MSFMTKERYSLTLASNSIGRVPSPPVVSKARKNCQAEAQTAEGKSRQNQNHENHLPLREYQEIDERPTGEEQNRCRHKERSQSLLLVLVQAWGHEKPELDQEDRAGNKGAEEERHFDLGKKDFGQIGEDQARCGSPPFTRDQDVCERLSEEVEKLFRKKEAD